MCVFYDTIGNKIEKREFIELYSSIYYYLNDFEIESSIEKLIFHTEERTSEDFVTFLRWKVGGKDYGKHFLSRETLINSAKSQRLFPIFGKI